MSSGLFDQSDVFANRTGTDSDQTSAIRPRLDSKELRRRLWHMSPGLFPIALWFVPHRDPISPTLMAIIASVAVLISARIYIQFRQIQRAGETNDGSAVLGYVLSVLCAFLLFPAHAEIGLTVLAILAFGDGSATLLGLAIGGPKLKWNPSKSWAGAIGFVAVALPIAAVVYWQETHNLEAIGPGVSFAQALLCVTPAVVLSMIAESVQSRVNDNIRVGVVSVASLAAMQAVLFGL